MNLIELKKAKFAKIENVTKGTVLAEKAKIANTSWLRMKGLLGKSGLEHGEGLIIVPCSAIHTFFMKFAIDVAFVDKNGVVVKLKKALKSGQYFSSNFKGKCVIELSAYALEIAKTEEGDEVKWTVIA